MVPSVNAAPSQAQQQAPTHPNGHQNGHTNGFDRAQSEPYFSPASFITGTLVEADGTERRVFWRADREGC